MNVSMIIGRITNDIELKYTSESQTAVCQINLAVNRPKRKGQEKADVDFIPCKIWGKTAENVEKYCGKGKRIAVQGSIQIDKYEGRDGNKKSFTYVNVSNVEFIDFKTKDDVSIADNPRAAQQESHQQPNDSFDVQESFQELAGDVPF